MSRRRWPIHGWLGLALVPVFWWLNWSLAGMRTHWGFFPLWLGYALTIDALVYLRKGSSMLTRNPAGYALLFLISAPAWWLFEILNERTDNWLYLSDDIFSDLDYFLLASLSFSTVMPAVFGTAELVGTFGWVGRLRRGPALALTRRNLLILFTIGCLMLFLLMAWPLYFYPFLWLSVYFILDPMNQWLGNRSLLQYIAQGDWRPYVTLALGCLICGYFWEMWNYYSYPKWTYTVPFVGFWRIFEMPLLGYGGYIPFSWELFALYHLVTGAFLRGRDMGGLVDVSPSPATT